VKIIIDFAKCLHIFFVSSYIPMVSTSGRALNSKQIREQLHDDSDSFSEISQDSGIDKFCIVTLMPK
jgi:hypothetical protein